MPIKNINQLIDQATKMLHDQNYSERVIKYDVSVWRKFLKFCDENRYKTYNSAYNEEFITGLKNSIPRMKASTIKRKEAAMKKLNLFAIKGGWTKGELNPLQELLPEFAEFLNVQDEYFVKICYSEQSRKTMYTHSSLVFRYFQKIGVTKISEIDSTRITAYLLTLTGHARSTVRGELSRLRMFLSNLQLFGYTTENLAKYVPEYRQGSSQSLIKIWESDELYRVLSVVERSNPKGKRDYAFIMIAAELGVRSKDICDLKLSDIDWETCSISFIQSKTRKSNTLPLSEKVGTAIIDYLQVRPQTASEYLFVNLIPPYEKMKSFHSSFHKYVMRSGIKIKPQAHHGLHSLRATVATKLLSADVSPDVIFSFLGHTNRSSLNHYIRLDIENLRECALSFEGGELI